MTRTARAGRRSGLQIALFRREAPASYRRALGMLVFDLQVVDLPLGLLRIGRQVETFFILPFRSLTGLSIPLNQF